MGGVVRMTKDLLLNEYRRLIKVLDMENIDDDLITSILENINDLEEQL